MDCSSRLSSFPSVLKKRFLIVEGVMLSTVPMLNCWLPSIGDPLCCSRDLVEQWQSRMAQRIERFFQGRWLSLLS